MANIKLININIHETIEENKNNHVSNTKRINMDLMQKKETQDKYEYVEKDTKIPRKRVVTNNAEWRFSNADLCDENQYEYLNQLYEGNVVPANVQICNVIIKQLKYKLSGYRSQDVLKKIYSEYEFITIDKVLKLLVECKCQCFYCNSHTKVLYEYVREPMQWSLERINNDIGHNDGNVTIACLNCNLRRRTMNQERYIFTKQLLLIKKE